MAKVILDPGHGGQDLGAVYVGVEAIIYGKMGVEEAVAENVNLNLKKVGFKSIGVIRFDENIELLRESKVPAVLELVGFINSDYDNDIYDTKFNDVANAIADGIIEVFGLPEENNTANSSDYHYNVQVGLYKVYNNAMNLQNHLIQEGYPAKIVQQGDYFAVQIGDYYTLDEAAEFERMLRMTGNNTIIVTV